MAGRGAPRDRPLNSGPSLSSVGAHAGAAVALTQIAFLRNSRHLFALWPVRDKFCELEPSTTILPHFAHFLSNHESIFICGGAQYLRETSSQHRLASSASAFGGGAEQIKSKSGKRIRPPPPPWLAKKPFLPPPLPEERKTYCSDNIAHKAAQLPFPVPSLPSLDQNSSSSRRARIFSVSVWLL